MHIRTLVKKLFSKLMINTENLTSFCLFRYRTYVAISTDTAVHVTSRSAFRCPSEFQRLHLSRTQLTQNKSFNGTMKPTRTSVRTGQLGNYICSSCSHQLRPQRRDYASVSQSTRPSIYDVVCVGGGPAGLSLLAALRMCPSLQL
jgi:hypothetical protein